MIKARPIDRVLDLLKGVKCYGDYWFARCPSHADKSQSLSVKEGRDGQVLFHCTAEECSVSEIASALGLEQRELWPASKAKPYQTNSRDDFWERIHVYHLPNGEPFFREVKGTWKDKETGKTVTGFPQHILLDDRWVNLKKAREKGLVPPTFRVELYNLPSVLDAAKNGGTVLLCEGAKDAETAIKLGFCATTNPRGALSFQLHMAQCLKGANVVVFVDNDKAGAKRVKKSKQLLPQYVRSLKFVYFGDDKKKGYDLTDWVEEDMGYSGLQRDAKALQKLIDEAPQWIPEFSEDDVIRFEYGKQVLTFGRICTREMEKKIDGEMLPVREVFARDVWPRQIYQSDDQDTGIRFAYKDCFGKIQSGTLPMGATLNKRFGASAARDLLDQGVQIAGGTDALFALALGHWKDKTFPPVVRLVRRAGWHTSKVYVNGDKIFGASGWFVDSQSRAISDRTERTGSLQGWRDGVASLCDTRGLILAIGVSLAGALIEPLGRKPFGVHVWGDSSGGKTTSALVAGSIWGHPDSTRKTWNTTLKSPEGLAECFNGACLILDDLAHFEYDERKLGEMIHAITAASGRSFYTSARKLGKQRYWRNTIFSNGEASIKVKMKLQYQGGHRVRMIDVRCDAGDFTVSDTHAKRIDLFTQQENGHAGDAWVKYLVGLESFDLIEKSVEKWYKIGVAHAPEGKENLRIVDQFSVICAALEHGHEAGILPSDDIAVFLKWLIDQSIGDSEEEETASSDPNMRAYLAFRGLVHTQPAQFPDPQKAENARNVIGYYERGDGFVNTTQSMNEASGLVSTLGFSMRSWVKWCEHRNLVAKKKNPFRLHGGQLGRWLTFDLSTEV